MRTIAAKFPQYSFEDLLDRTPAFIRWALLQAMSLDEDLARKIGLLSQSAPASAKKPATKAEENALLSKLGFKVGR